MKKLISLLDVSKPICSHVIGKKHSKIHRRYCGVLMMAIGVFIAEVIGGTNHYFAFPSNMLGYALHGVGLLPFIEIDE